VHSKINHARLLQLDKFARNFKRLGWARRYPEVQEALDEFHRQRTQARGATSRHFDMDGLGGATQTLLNAV